MKQVNEFLREAYEGMNTVVQEGWMVVLRPKVTRHTPRKTAERFDNSSNLHWIVKTHIYFCTCS